MTTYFAALRALAQPIRAAAWEQTLEPMCHLLDVLGNPQEGLRAVVVTGSTGKGTACLRIASALSAAGRRVGLYTSPHLHSFRERFAMLSEEGRHTGLPLQTITPQELVDAAQPVLAAAQALSHPYSTFEYATALALAWFAQQDVEMAVLEVGIGGRFDAVNVTRNVLAVFTPIEAEHVAMLGGSLESVAWHKAGIIQPGGAAISAAQLPIVEAILQREAAEKSARLQIVERLDAASLALPGLPPVSLAQDSLSLPGRLERISVAGKDVIVDGGHTANAARYLRDFIGDAESIRLVVGMLRDKDAAAYLSVFDAPNVQIVYAQAPGDRALTPDELLVRYRPTEANYVLVPSLDAALAEVYTAQEARFVVAGSLRMAAAAREAYGLLKPEALDEARQTRAIFAGEEYQNKIR